MVVQFCGQCRELVVVDYHRKTLGRMLLDERLDDGECLTRSRRTDNPCASEGIDDVHPALTELPLVVVSHGDVHRIFVLLKLLILLKRLVFQIETVIKESCLQMLGCIIKSRMNEQRSEYRCYHIYPDVCADGI